MECSAIHVVGVFEDGRLAPCAVANVKCLCGESCPALSVEEPRVCPHKYDCCTTSQQGKAYIFSKKYWTKQNISVLLAGTDGVLF